MPRIDVYFDPALATAGSSAHRWSITRDSDGTSRPWTVPQTGGSMPGRCGYLPSWFARQLAQAVGCSARTEPTPG